MFNIVALITPYKKNHNIDWLNLNFLINFHINNKINLILLLGTTGEGHNFDILMFFNIIIFVKKFKIKFIFNIFDVNIKLIFKKIFFLKKNFFFIILISIPKYILPNNVSIFKYCKSINKFGIKIIFYNIPKRNSKKISFLLFKKLIKKKFFFYIKNSNNNIINNIFFKKNKILILFGEDKNLFFRSFFFGTISVYNNLLPKIFFKLNKNIILYFKKNNFEINPILIKFFLSKSFLIKGIFNNLLFGINPFFFTQSQT
ncbi:dihydrodipicolinate synthase family protein [Candidatus Carsonella ruddii]|uniref:Dihydrodipicolinate synthase n=1 Tax=Candidatus Carsonella ruddii HC isolate Thao2000 TaxID=1202538 RepID=J3YQ44_CARRU|nr:dihydrodipicolinate synthase family protein [Candidatus Carsonella ruddii]AFP83973.1 dihydrodipicolinate synthase [Candidatus Carsonella ruddii HC isolate Thao2000]